MARTANVGRISVSLDANTVAYLNKIKKAQTVTEQRLNKMSKSYKRLGKASNSTFSGLTKGATAVAASTAALGALVTAASAARNEHEQLARAAGMSGDQFDSLTAVFGTVGIEAEKSSDLLRDLNIKISEAAVLGSGAGKDAMDKLGISIGSIKDKAPIEQLNILNDRMQELGYSADAQKLIWDEFGSDLDKLQPLLVDGAKALKSLTAEADRLDVKIPKAALESLESIGFSADIAKNNMTELGAYVGGQFGKVIKESTGEMATMTQQLIDWNEKANAIGRTIDFVVGVLTTLKNTGEIAALGLESSFNLMAYAGEKWYDSLKYAITNVGTTFDEVGSSIGNQWDISLEEMSIAMDVWIRDIGSKLSGVPIFGKLGDDLVAAADASINASNAAIDKIDKKQADIDKAKADRELTFSNMRTEKQQAFFDKQIAIQEAIAQNAKELGLGIQQTSGAIYNTNEKSTLPELPTASSTTDEEGESALEKSQSYFNEMFKQYEDFDKKVNNLRDETAEKQSSRLLGDVDQVGAAFGAQLGLQQTFAKAQAAITSTLAAIQVWSDPSLSFYEKLPASLSAAAAVAGLAGQFHGGTDEVPTSMDNKSFMLKAGERVVQPEANKKLTKFLNSAGDGGEGVSGTTNITSNFTMGPSLVDEKVFAEALSKNQTTLAALVEKQQRKYPTRRR